MTQIPLEREREGGGEEKAEIRGNIREGETEGSRVEVDSKGCLIVQG